MSDKARVELGLDEKELPKPDEVEKKEFITTEVVEGRQTWQKPVSASNGSTCLGCKRKYMFQARWCIFPNIQSPKPAAALGRMGHRLLQVGPDGVDQVKKEVQAKFDLCMQD